MAALLNLFQPSLRKDSLIFAVYSSIPWLNPF
jgi:hypothetical protein